MRKSKLMEIPYLHVQEKDRKFVALYGQPYLVKPERAEVEGEQILILNVYQKEQLMEKKTAPVYRIFHSRQEFLTEMVEEQRWSVKTLKNLLKDYEYRPKAALRLLGEERMVRRFFRKGNTEKSALELVGEVQEQKKKWDAEKKEKQEKKRVKRLFSKAKPFSDSFVRWLDEQAMYRSQYIFYDYARKKQLSCICSHCKATFELDQRIPRHNKEGKCPVCRRPAVFKAKGKIKNGRLTDWGEAVKLERMENGVLIRHLEIWKTYHVDDPDTWKVSYHEDYRTFLQEDGTVENYKRKEWENGWRKTYLSPYFPYQYHFPYTEEAYKRQKNMPGILYTRNLKQCLAGTAFQYSGLETYGRHFCRDRHEPIEVKKYLEMYRKTPQLEYFVKAGFYRLSTDILQGYAKDLIDPQAKGLCEVLRLPKAEIRFLRQHDLDYGYVRLFQSMERFEVKLSGEEKQNFYRLYGNNEELLKRNAQKPLRKIASYLAKQAGRYWACSTCRLDSSPQEMPERERPIYQNLAADWLDYVRWSEEMQHDIQSSALLFPKNLGKAHDKRKEEYRRFQRRKEQEELREMRKRTDQILKKEAKLVGGKIEDENHLFVVPENWKELRKEGDVLGHCVGEYVTHIAKKECIVYFVRKKENPEEPYYTVDWRNGKVVQCQGKGRCAPTEEVVKFLAYAGQKLLLLKETEKKAA